MIRLNQPLPPRCIAALAREFADIIEPAASIEPCAAFPVERDDPATLHLPRIAFRFDRRNFGRLRMLIDRINAASDRALLLRASGQARAAARSR